MSQKGVLAVERWRNTGLSCKAVTQTLDLLPSSGDLISVFYWLPKQNQV